jgi:endoglucanase
VLPDPKPSRLPRWRGFNLEDKKDRNGAPHKNGPYREQDFEIAAGWGFDFLRLPVDFRIYIEGDDWFRLKEPALVEIDQAVAWGKEYGVHTCLNTHQLPGYSIHWTRQPVSLWTDERAQEASAHHWAHFAERYKGIPNSQLSFNLLNEPFRVDAAAYGRVMAQLAGAIRAYDPDRLVIVDGLEIGWNPVPGLESLGVAQSLHAYMPFEVSHYRAEWFGKRDWPEPAWPFTLDGKVWDKDTLRRDWVNPWRELANAGTGVHVGEFGSYRHTPHDVTLAYMKDLLELFAEAGWGWAIWNLRGAYGVLNSGRSDVAYEEFRGHKLDRQMLELLQAY